MTTLAADSPRTYELGDRNEIAMIASDIIYEGAAVGVVPASGHAQPLAATDVFAGFAEAKADNSTGSAADINVRVRRSGSISLSVSGAVITDLNQPVYATDDDTFIFLPTAAVFIGFVRRFVSAGVVIVEFDVDNYVDPYAGRVRESFGATATLTKVDTGKVFFITADAIEVDLLAEAVATSLNIKVVNMGAYGTQIVTIDPDGADLISGPDDTGGVGGALVNTKATAQRGDYVVIEQIADEGYLVTEKKGIWTIA